MADWGPVLVGVILFVLLSPGLFLQIPGNCRAVEFCNVETSGRSIAMHTLIFFALFSLFTIIIGVHIYTD